MKVLKLILNLVKCALLYRHETAFLCSISSGGISCSVLSLKVYHALQWSICGFLQGNCLPVCYS